MDFMNSTYSITDVMDSIIEFEKKTGESFFDFTLTQVDGKIIKVCREKEIKGGIIVDDEYDLYIVQNEICITIKRDSVLNMFNNLDDYISEHTKTKEVEIEIVQQ